MCGLTLLDNLPLGDPSRSSAGSFPHEGRDQDWKPSLLEDAVWVPARYPGWTGGRQSRPRSCSRRESTQIHGWGLPPSSGKSDFMFRAHLIDYLSSFIFLKEDSTILVSTVFNLTLTEKEKIAS
jgi:hypothetical protein